MNLQQGTLLQGGKYKILRYINSGGFGCTYEAVHLMLDKKVAIKEFFVKDFCNRDENSVNITVGTTSKVGLVSKLKKKFIDEAVALCKLHHSNIVSVTDVFEENGTAYYVMEYIEGSSLNELIKTRGKLDEQTSLRYIRQVSEALCYVHSQNRLHLDIKPGNIMIDKKDNAILIDFGASKQYDEANGENTSTLMGKTPGYAPLEQMGNEVTQFYPATDIYSLGATLYKALTGITPLSANFLASGEELEPLPDNISENTKKAIYESMNINKKKRPQSIADFLKLLDGEGVKTQDDDEATEIVGVERPKPTEPKKEEPKQDLPNEQKPKKKKSKAWIFILLAIIIGGAGYYFVNDKMKEEKKKEAEMLAQAEQERIKKEQEAAQIAQAQKEAEAKQKAEAERKRKAEQARLEREAAEKAKYNVHEYVDLGLSVKWATCNVGASKPEDYGNYYAWGETSTKSFLYIVYNSKTYGKQMNDIKGNSQYDAARANWGGTWRLPTKAECQELVDKCTWTWTAQNGVKGYKVTGPNGNSIFLPAAGDREQSSLNYAGVFGYYWSSTPDDDDYDVSAYYLSFDSGCQYVGWDYRYYGLSVRPVSDDIYIVSVNNETFTVNGVSFTMIKVEGGTFNMGAQSTDPSGTNYDSDACSDEKPVHSVTLSDYYICETEVTQELWEAVMGSNPSKFKGSQKPVEEVSWNDCKEFIAKLNRLTGKNFRLPTEAEWEYAARGGNKSKGYKYSGSNTIGNVAWYTDNSSSKTHDVKTKTPNELGIYDMSGNVYEWCEDWKGSYSSGSQTNLAGPSSGSRRVLRGGYWSGNAKYCRVSNRDYNDPGGKRSIGGFRLALSQ